MTDAPRSPEVPNTTPDSVDVVVIGAGLAGLSAARSLAQRGLRVRVLEARDRVGGRTLSHRLPDGDIIELGAQWLGPGQDRLSALCRELGLHTFAQTHQGTKVLSLGDRLSTYKGDIPSLPLLGLLDLQRTLSRVDQMARSVPLHAPESAPHAAEWDGMTVESWARSHIHTEGARSLFDIAVAAIFAAEPSELSLLYFLQYIHAGGGVMKLSTIHNGAQETRLVEGFQQVSVRLAESPPLAGSVQLNEPVTAVAQDDRGVRVTTARASYRAQHCIVAIPPTLCNRIDFQPALPAARIALQSRMPMGSVCKCIAVYPRPFWKERGFSGEAVSDRGPIRAVFDDSPHPGSKSGHGALIGFMLGDHLRQQGERDAALRRQDVLGAFARFFGDDALHPIDYIEKNWTAEPWSAGCYTGIMPPATLTRFGQALRAPIGRIHFAGTETATHWTGYMDGALESGGRAADEILARLAAR